MFHVALLLPWVILVIDSFDRIVDNSFLWHVRAGTIQIEAGQVLTSDPFSLTLAGERWITQSWLAEVLYGWLEGRFGLGFTGVMLLLAGLITVAGVGMVAYRRSRSLVGTAAAVLLTAILLPRFLVPRPVLFSYPLFALVMLAWERRSTRWSVPLLLWIWASVHASFVIGLAYLAFVILWRREWKAMPTALASAVTALITAQGLGIVAMLGGFAGSARELAMVAEWGAPDFISAPLLPFLVGIIVLLIGAATGRLAPAMLWVIAPFLILAFSAERAVVIAWLALAPFAAVSLSEIEVRSFAGFPWPVALGLSAAILITPWGVTNPVELDSSVFPVSAARQLDAEPTFNDTFTGGYLIWLDQPGPGVFIDDRVELYRAGIKESVDIRRGRAPWRPVFEEAGISQALLRAGDPLVEDLLEAGWISRHEDDVYVVLKSTG